MTSPIEIARSGRPAEASRPWPRFVVDRDAWRALGRSLAAGGGDLMALWGERAAVHLAFRDGTAGGVAIATVEAVDGAFPSIAALLPAAIRPERTVADLFGLVPEGEPDGRRWLDHTVWPVCHPLGAAAPRTGPGRATDYTFLPVEGESLHRIPVGPVHAGIIEPGHFRFTANGETVVRLEERLGYVHKGIESLLAGADLARAAKLAARVSGDSTVAYGFAFARAVEAACGVEAPPRAAALRGVMAEMERIANHLGDIGAVCNDASFAMMNAHCAALREQVLRAAAAAFGHRLMMDRIVPGGVAADLGPDGMRAIAAMLSEIGRRFPRLVTLYDDTASLQDRTVSTGRVAADLVARFAAGGHVGRASGRDFDARRDLAYPPYDRLEVDVPVLAAGDVDARVRIRIREVEVSLGLIRHLLHDLPDGPAAVALPPGPAGAEGMAVVESFRGDVLVWLRLGPDGGIERCHPRDPSWFQWPLLEAAIEGNIVADFPLCNKSFNCSYSGHDL